MDSKIIFEQESYAIRGAVFEVCRQIGCGFLESVYQDCLRRELLLKRIPFESQKRLQLQYKGQVIEPVFIADFVCYDKIIVEIKAVSDTSPAHEAQVLNYLKMTELQLGFLVNFGHYPKATIKRITNIEKKENTEQSE